MKYSTILTVAAATLSSASPVGKRTSGPTDAEILNYALTLEHLEAAFYRVALDTNYTEAAFTAAGFDSTFYSNLQTVKTDEATHVDFLTTALTAAGAPATKPCTYAFPSTDVTSFLAVAAVLEGVGVSAYLGAAASIMEKDYLTAAGSILTVEARHTAYIRGVGTGQSPFAQPFDVPLSFNAVYTLAAAFIVSCPADNPPLPVRAFPTLTAAPTAGAMTNVTAGTSVTLKTPGTVLEVPNGGPVYAAFFTVTGPIIVDATRVDPETYTISIPRGVNGQSYVVLTGCKDSVTDDTVAAGPAIIEITN